MIRPFHLKKALAFAFENLYINDFLCTAQKKKYFPFIRGICYHDVSPLEADRFEQQLQYFAENYSPVDEEDIYLLTRNSWKKDKPGILLSFDDGYRSFSEVVAPLLERYGFKGWFFIPPDLIDIPVEEQTARARENHLRPKPYPYGSPRVMMTWEEIIQLDKNHIVGCHTLTHRRLSANLSQEVLCQEIIDSKAKLERKVNHPISAFAWVGGEEKSCSREAARVIREANYEFSFLVNNSLIRSSTNLHLLDRTNIESDFPIELLKFQLSGMIDILYTFKRRRVAKLLTS